MFSKIERIVEESISRSRRERFKFILKHIESFKRAIKILDVGGTVEYWRGSGFDPSAKVSITLLNLFRQDVPEHFESQVADARDLSRFADKSFDFVFSNSVINLMPSREDQATMAREIQRVGRTFLVQCPNKWFPIDWRTWMPFFHYLPRDAQVRWLCRLPAGRYPRTADRARAKALVSRTLDLSIRELKDIFLGASIYKENWLGFTKSIAAYDFTKSR